MVKSGGAADDRLYGKIAIRACGFLLALLAYMLDDSFRDVKARLSATEAQVRAAQLTLARLELICKLP